MIVGIIISVLVVLYLIFAIIGKLYFYFLGKKGDEEQRVKCLYKSQNYISAINTVAIIFVYAIFLIFLVWFVLKII